MNSKTIFGKTDLSVSRLGFGSAPVGYLETDFNRASLLLNQLLDHGVNLIDTAECYPGSEELIGKAISHRRNDFILVTKCGHEVKGIEAREWSAKLILETVDRSLHRLKTDHLDVVLLHSCSLEILKEGSVLAALAKARAAGKVRFIGYSGDNEAAAYAATRLELAVIETSINLCDQANIEAVLPVAVKHRQGILAKRPIANAVWKPLQDLPGIYQSYAKPYHERLRQMNIPLSELGVEGSPDQIWPELALRFTLSQPGVHTAILGTTRPDRIKVNLAIVEKGPLPEIVVQKIHELFRAAEIRSGTKWPGLT